MKHEPTSSERRLFRTVVRSALGCAALACTGLLTAQALAQSSAGTPALARPGNFPGQTIRLISPFPPGGGNDFHARLIAGDLGAVTGQTTVVENRGGAGGNIGAKGAAEAAPDGHTLFNGQVSIMAVNPTLYKAAGFDPLRNFMPVIQINAAPLAIVVQADSPFKNMADLKAQSRLTPGKINYATPGNGTLSHLVGVLLEKDGGIDLTHVPYRGAGPAMSDLLGGQVTVMITSTSSVAPMIQQGKLRALAVTSGRRLGVFKSVPTLEEQGFKDMTFDDWYGVFAPAGTPPERVAYLNQAIARVLKSATVTQKIQDGGSEVVAGTPAELAAQLKLDIARWSRVVKLSGAQID